MSKELVISATSHERRVAILEEGQLVEIYIEQEKEFALVGSIYKGKVTRVLPGMQSAFVDIGLDGDAFLYVSDVFENLEDYEPHEHHAQHVPTPAAAAPAGNGSTVELLPGESLARATEKREEPRSEEFHPEPAGEQGAASPEETSPLATQEVPRAEGQPASQQPAAAESAHAESGEERQPDSNASAPQNFSSHFNPTQNYSRRSGNDRGSDRGNDRQGQHYGRGGDRGRGGRWGRRGGRHRGGRQQGGPGGRNLPPSKYASPQGGEFRGGYDNRDRGQQRGYDNRRQEGPRSSGPSSADVSDETILLPGESLAKYRDKPVASPAAAPVVEQESHNDSAIAEETSPRPANTLPVATSGSAGVPRRFSGGLPSWLLAEGASEAGKEATSEAFPVETESPSALSAQECEPASNGAELNDDQVAALAADLAEAKHEEVVADAEADAVVGGAVFEEEDSEEENEVAEDAETVEEVHAEAGSGLSPEDAAEVEAHRAADRAEFAAEVAHESAEHIVSLGEQSALLEEIHEGELDHAEAEEEDHALEAQSSEEHFEVEQVHAEAEGIRAPSGEGVVE